MKIQVKNLSNENVREIDVPEAVFGYPFKEHLIHIVIEALRAAERSGTHAVKNRKNVRGGGKKPWRQKGTGRARVGSNRSPIWRGGGIVHGPVNRSHAKGVSPREKKNALRSALSRKLSEDGIMVIDSLALDSHKTRELAKSLDGLGLAGKTLLVDTQDNQKLRRAARNHPKLKTVDALGVNVYDVVDRTHVVFSTQALERLVEVLTP